MQALRDVIENYAASKAQRVAKRTESPDKTALLQTLPSFFEGMLGEFGHAPEFLVKGSIGSGNVPHVPWVATFRRAVTTSAKRGFYVVLLFAEDLSRCYLSLNQGFTEFSDQYSEKVGREKIQDVAKRAGRLLSQDGKAILGPINLMATRSLGQGYEVGAIKSYEYLVDHLPRRQIIEHDFSILLADYDTLYSIAGPSLSSLMPLIDGEFQTAVRVLANKAQGKLLSEPSGGIAKSPSMAQNFTGYARRIRVAAAAVRKADFRCEVDACHSTFLTEKNIPYIEAHHLIPFSRQDEYGFSLDVTANLVALCPTCHRKLHYGRAIDKNPILKKLLKERSVALIEKQIPVLETTLLGYYRPNLMSEAD